MMLPFKGEGDIPPPTVTEAEGNLIRRCGAPEPAEQMTNEVLLGWSARLYCDRGAEHIDRGPHPTSLRSATFPIGEGLYGGDIALPRGEG